MFLRGPVDQYDRSEKPNRTETNNDICRVSVERVKKSEFGHHFPPASFQLTFTAQENTPTIGLLPGSCPSADIL
uniref:Uncharacterized protein n=1 Tax=Anopheles quadriannulatus TaxID=34691 RepID=A0A182XL79_ANOQN